MAGAVGGWCVVMRNQLNGRYLCDSIFVQMQDDFVSALGTFSGVYDRVDRQTHPWKDERVVYVERNSGRARFGYCQEDDVWTFSFDTEDEPRDPCDWQVKSEETDGFDILELATETWIARDERGRISVLDHFFMTCFDCSFFGEDEMCSGHGECSNAVCTCEEGRFGPQCEFLTPCDSIEIDERTLPFTGARDFSREYTVLTDGHGTLAQSYFRPVYFHEYGVGLFDVLMFTGRRWVLTYSTLMTGLLTMNTTVGNERQTLFKYVTSFHGHWTDYAVSFISSPVDEGTALNSESPVGVSWYPAEIQQSGGIQSPNGGDGVLNTELICTVCNAQENPCLSLGHCVDGSCVCPPGSSGTLCQFAPLGDGFCNNEFNRPEFAYDEGDCCEASCVSTDKFTCGRDADGLTFLGYPDCHLPRQEWLSISKPIQPSETPEPKYSLALAAGGRVLIVGEPKNNRLRIYDRDGSQWIQRGAPMLGPPNADKFGCKIASSNGIDGVVRNSIALPSVIVAVAAELRGSDYFTIRVYRCWTGGCQQVGGEILPEHLLGISLALSAHQLRPSYVQIAVGGQRRYEAGVYHVDEDVHVGSVTVYHLASGRWMPRGTVPLEVLGVTIPKRITTDAPTSVATFTPTQSPTSVPTSAPTDFNNGTFGLPLGNSTDDFVSLPGDPSSNSTGIETDVDVETNGTATENVTVSLTVSDTAVYDVTLSPEGDYLVVGVVDKTYLRQHVFSWDFDTSLWVPQGSLFRQERVPGSSSGMGIPTKNFAISNNGKILAIGTSSPGVETGVQVYISMGATWEKRGPKFATHDYMQNLEVIDVAMTTDAHTVAVKARHATEGDVKSTVVHVFGWNGKHYVPNVQIPAEYEAANALAADGSALALSVSDGLRGPASVQIYDYLPAT